MSRLARYLPLHGWQASVGRGLFSHFDVVLDAAGHYGTINNTESLSDLSFMAGPRFHIRAGAITLFAHGLGGWGQRTDTAKAFVDISESTSGFAWAVGGGLSLRVSGHWDVRVQADYWSVDAGSPTNHQDDRNVRAAAGIAYRFGRKIRRSGIAQDPKARRLGRCGGRNEKIVRPAAEPGAPAPRVLHTKKKGGRFPDLPRSCRIDWSY